MAWLDKILGRNKELEIMFDIDLIEDPSKRIQLKKLAFNTCINFIAKTISQAEFRYMENGKFKKDEIYYRLNIRPNLNQTAAEFWEKVIYKLIYDNECLIIHTDTDDLLIADTFTRDSYAVFEDTFKSVVVDDYEFQRTFTRDNVIYLTYNNERLTPLLNGLYEDYGELFGRIVKAQMRKNQIRATVDIESIHNPGEETQKRIQNFIDRLYNAFGKRDIAVVPQQKGFKYEEHTKNAGSGQSVEEVDKVADGFLTQVARAMNIPPSLVKGEMADVENQTKNFMFFCINPFIEKISDELNARLLTKEEYMSGKEIVVRKPSYRDIFDVATAVDKLRAAGITNGNELRDKLGWEPVDDPILENYYITKNYTEQSDSLEGGEVNEAQD